MRAHNPSKITYTTICVHILCIYITNIYVYIYSLHKSNNYSLKSAQNKSVIILWEEDDANIFTWYLKFHADGPTIFQPSIPGWKIIGPPVWNFQYQVKLFCTYMCDGDLAASLINDFWLDQCSLHKEQSFAFQNFICSYSESFHVNDIL